MATVTAGFTLTSAVGDLLTDGLALSDSVSITASHTSGLARKTLTSVSKTNRVACLDGDAATDGATLEGQFIDITDNHGITKDM